MKKFLPTMKSHGFTRMKHGSERVFRISENLCPSVAKRFRNVITIL